MLKKEETSVMHDTFYNRKAISMSKEVRNSSGEIVRIPQGMIDILQQRGNTEVE